ncbi:GntR family transcriptional regulator [Lachnoclostridium sp. An14]|uniref:GntR family transcriptional regulator n=1 Tax=Lachnoclostridium sp. An14 TaxID=1965562 RepID=UPI000B36BC5A|nr:GntR family transcriptional regulator [Lachnoclostridium sp. An14]OUQ17403.1 GntR family transcriptional regulator [Lachnoclostridium sp. An14]
MDYNLKVTMNEYLPLRDVVFNTLRQAILKGELEPGERLMEIQLAERLGVSRTPIREAIRKLELEGLVLMIPRKGAEVAKISARSLRDVLEVRRALEELAIELACQRMTEEDLGELQKAQDEFKKAIADGDAMRIAETDEHYHDVIYSGTQNAKLIQMLNNLREQMYRYRLEYIKDADKRKILILEHERVLKAIRDRKVAEAKEAMREHIDNQEITVARNITEKENG